MPDFRRMSLNQLRAFCPPLLQVTSAVERDAWAELQQRALVAQNPAAWDLLLLCLWPSLLSWIYAYAPETSPAVARRFALRVLCQFQRQQLAPISHTTLIVQLHHTVIQLLNLAAPRPLN